MVFSMIPGREPISPTTMTRGSMSFIHKWPQARQQQDSNIGSRMRRDKDIIRITSQQIFSINKLPICPLNHSLISEMIMTIDTIINHLNTINLITETMTIHLKVAEEVIRLNDDILQTGRVIHATIVMNVISPQTRIVILTVNMIILTRKIDLGGREVRKNEEKEKRAQRDWNPKIG